MIRRGRVKSCYRVAEIEKIGYNVVRKCRQQMRRVLPLEGELSAEPTEEV